MAVPSLEIEENSGYTLKLGSLKLRQFSILIVTLYFLVTKIKFMLTRR